MASILVVDDEPVVVQVACGALEPMGYTVVTASTSAQAYQAAAQMERIDVLNHKIKPERVISVFLNSVAKHNGAATSQNETLLTHPEAKVMHISGWPKGQLEAEDSLTPGAAFLAKPFTIPKIRTAVAALLVP